METVGRGVRLWAAGLALCAPLVAVSEDAYKCTDGVRITYSDKPCASGRQQVFQITVTPESLLAAQRERAAASRQQAINEARHAAALRAQQDAQEVQAANAAQQAAREQSLIEAASRAAAAAEEANRRAAQPKKPLNCFNNFGNVTCYPNE